jgi:hypothetical protein
MLILLLASLVPAADACRPALIHADWIAPMDGSADVPADARLLIGLSGSGDPSNVSVSLVGPSGLVLTTQRGWTDAGDVTISAKSFLAVDPGVLAAGEYTVTVTQMNNSASLISTFDVIDAITDGPDKPSLVATAIGEIVERSDTCTTGTFRPVSVCGSSLPTEGLELAKVYRVDDEDTALDIPFFTSVSEAGVNAIPVDLYASWTAADSTCFRVVTEAANGTESEPSDILCIDDDTPLMTCSADLDDDGFDAAGAGGLDCDDLDDTVNPDADEVWYDGIDQDCDGASDNDQDADGYDDPEDCDDEDNAINPGATDIEDDGIDQDCDGSDAVSSVPEDPDSELDTDVDTTSTDGGCQTSPRAPFSLALLMALAVRRRSRKR